MTEMRTPRKIAFSPTASHNLRVHKAHRFDISEFLGDILAGGWITVTQDSERFRLEGLFNLQGEYHLPGSDTLEQPLDDALGVVDLLGSGFGGEDLGAGGNTLFDDQGLGGRAADAQMGLDDIAPGGEEFS